MLRYPRLLVGASPALVTSSRFDRKLLRTGFGPDPAGYMTTAPVTLLRHEFNELLKGHLTYGLADGPARATSLRLVGLSTGRPRLRHSALVRHRGSSKVGEASADWLSGFTRARTEGSYALTERAPRSRQSRESQGRAKRVDFMVVRTEEFANGIVELNVCSNGEDCEII